ENLPTEPGYYWFASESRILMDSESGFDITEPWVINIQHWADCAPNNQMWEIEDKSTLVVVHKYNHGALVYDLLGRYKGIFSAIGSSPPLPQKYLDLFQKEKNGQEK